MAAFTLAGFGFPFLGVEGCGGQNDPFVGAGFDGGDVGVGADVDAFRLEIRSPITIESLKVWERHHLGKVGKEGFRIVIPEFHVGIIEQTFKDRA